MSQNVFSITDSNVPVKNDDFILLDTSVVISITGLRNATSPRTSEAIKFINDMAHKNTIFVIPTKAWEELNIIFENQHIGKSHKNPNIDTGPLIENVTSSLIQIKNSLNTFPNIFTDGIGNINESTLKKAEENRTDYKLRWGDAVILSIAQQEGITNIFTFDKDYTNVTDPNINILVNSDIYKTYSNQTTNNTINVNCI